MEEVAIRIPLLIVVRELGAPALTPALRALERRAPGERWSLLVQESQVLLTAPANTLLYQFAPDCICCTGQLALRTYVARTLRQDRPDGIVLELASHAHLSRITDALSILGFAERLQIETIK